MGSSISQGLAELTLRKIEEIAFSIAPMVPSFYKRYVDDGFTAWEGQKTDIVSFVDTLSSIQPTIKFTIEFENDAQKLPYLDVLIAKSEGSFVCSIYRKPTHNDRYLPYDSYQPEYVKRGVVISLVDRAIKICDEALLDDELCHIRDGLFGNK